MAPPPPEPIPLRTLTTLLNYERLISDPRYINTSLHSSSIAEPSTLPQVLQSKLIQDRPSTITKINFRTFHHDATTPNPAPQSPLAKPTCTIQPDSNPTTHKLSSAQLEDIFHESRSHDRCYKALALFQEFFSLCSPDQQSSIQIRNEEPILVPIFPRVIIDFNTINPKILNVESLKNSTGGAIYITGGETKSFHSILGFPIPRSDMQNATLDDFFVVDMSCVQWDERGMLGEPYFIGKGAEWQGLMGKVLGDMEELGIGASWIGESEHTALMRECAGRAWERWGKRGMYAQAGDWCEVCGVGGGEEGRRVWYCGVEHQRRGWKLHRLNCEARKGGIEGVGLSEICVWRTIVCERGRFMYFGY